MDSAETSWFGRRKLLLGALAAGSLARPLRAFAGDGMRFRRLLDRPIIAPGMDARMGANIEGPSLIRTPDWLPNRLGRYYLYFADHKGQYIRLAYADALRGPWKVHAPGSLQLAQSRLLTIAPSPPPGSDVNELARRNAAGAPPDVVGIPSVLENASLPHVASPDVHVDHARRQIRMYYHGLTAYESQHSRVALSHDGVHFEGVGDELGPPYMRTFEYEGWTYAIAMPGVFLRSGDGLKDFEVGPTLFGKDQRHTAVLRRGNRLHVFWTRVGDAPERIYVSGVNLGPDWKTWRAEAPVEVLRPERPWEGATLPIARSYRSAVNVEVNQLRDPAIYEEDGRTYLLYAVKGEHGIGLGELFL